MGSLEYELVENMLNVDTGKSYSKIDLLHSMADVLQHVNKLEKILDYYREECKRLKDDNYKDRELSKLSEEINRLKRVVKNSLFIDETERKEIDEWWKSHVKEKHFGDDVTMIYTITDSVGIVKCSCCGEEYIFRQDT